MTSQSYETESVTSKDGTTISYFQLGQGPGVVLIQGAMGSAQTYMQLTESLSNTFTVYLPERRGRGKSGPFGNDYTIQKDVEDLDAILLKTGAHNVFGLSSGALILLQSLRTLSSIHKAIIFEPPLSVNGSISTTFLKKFDQQIAEGKIAAALITGMKAGEFGPSFMNVMPNWLLEIFTNLAIKNEDKKGSGNYLPLRELAVALHYDFQLVAEMAEKVDSFKDISAKLLLLGGSESPAYLKISLNALEKVLPKAKRIEINHIGHAGSWNTDRGGKPELVAIELRNFLNMDAHQFNKQGVSGAINTYVYKEMEVAYPIMISNFLAKEDAPYVLYEDPTGLDKLP